VEGLEIELRAEGRPGALATLEPDTLADLVADRLSRPAQVAIDFTSEKVLRFVAMLESERQQ